MRLSKQTAPKYICATECSARCHARPDGRAMWVAYNYARFPATRPRVFCELKIMKIVILYYQIIQEKFACGELFMLVMIGYIFMFKMVKKMQNSRLEMIAGLTRPLSLGKLILCKIHNALFIRNFYIMISLEHLICT